jgi:hydroxymethylpyrimidine/phosphomethylpyrimidine kinase
LEALEIPQESVVAQLEAVFDDMEVAAVKTGMLANAAVVAAVASALRRQRPRRFVLDPVMRAQSGDALLAEDAVAVLRDELLPLASLVTPNRHEAEALAGLRVDDLDGAAAAGRAILARGCGAVLVKGGHLDGPTAADVLVTREGVEVFEAPRLEARHVHGTGCTLSAAIATFLGRGVPLRDSVQRAKRYVTEAIRSGLDIGRGAGPTDHFFYLRGPDTEAWLEAFELRRSSP